MKILFIGGTGTISSAITKQIILSNNHELELTKVRRFQTLIGNIPEIK